MAATQIRQRTAPPPPPPPDELEPEPQETSGSPKKQPKTTKHEDGEEFWQLLSGISEEEWSNHLVYWYRLKPKIDRTVSGRGLNITTTAHPFTLDTVMKQEGSGVYRFDLLRRDPKTGKSGLVHRHYDQILNMTYPPRVPYGDWLKEAENAAWKWAAEPLRLQQAQSDAKVEAMEHGVSMSPSDPSQIFTTILEGVRTLRPENGDGNAGLASQLLAVVLKNQDTMQALNDPAKQLATLKTLLDTLRPPQPEGESLTMMMLGFFKEQTAALRQEITELRQPRKSIAEELKELSEIASAMGFTKRGQSNSNHNPGSNGTNWGDVAVQALDKVAERFAPYVPAIVNGFMQPKGPAGPQQQPQQQPPPAAAALPAPQPNPGATPMPAAEQLSPEMTQRISTFTTKYSQLLNEVMPFVIDHFTSKEGGAALKDWFISRKSEVAWRQLRDDSDPELLATMLEQHPVLRMVFTPREQVLQYFSEFFEDDEDDDAEDGPTGADNAA